MRVVGRGLVLLAMLAVAGCGTATGLAKDGWAGANYVGRTITGGPR